MAALTGKEIIKQYREGNILIKPFNSNYINRNSYDVCLGANFLYMPTDSSPMFNQNQWSEGMAQKWEDVQASLIGQDVIDDNNLINDQFEPDDLIIVLRPGEMILAYTEEFICPMPGQPYIGVLQTKSSIRRSYIIVDGTEVYGRWNLEIRNTSWNKLVPLKIGQKIAEIAFYTTTGELTDTAKLTTNEMYDVLEKKWSI